MSSIPPMSDIARILDGMPGFPERPQSNEMINMLHHYPFDPDVDIWSETSLPDVGPITKSEPKSPSPHNSPVYTANSPLYPTSSPVYHTSSPIYTAKSPVYPGSPSSASSLPSSSPEYYTLVPVKQDPVTEATKPIGLTMLQALRDVSYSTDPLSAPTAILQPPVEPEPEQFDLDIWDSQSPELWTPKHVMSFVHFVAAGMHFDQDFHGERFRNKTGADLMRMTQKDFCEIDANYGPVLYDVYKLLRDKASQHCFDDIVMDHSSLPLVPKTVHSYLDTSAKSPQSDDYLSDENSKDGVVPSNVSKEETVKKPKRRATSQRSGPHLWEFIRNLLLDENYSKIISWEDREQGVFRIVHSEAVARLWGRQKNNGKMSYEKLSRALRFCREAKYFEKLPANNRFPKKLCFKFGPRSDGWK